MCEGEKRKIEKERERTGNVHNIACESTHPHTHFVPRVNRRELDVNVPPFSFNRPLETVQRAFCWLIGEIRRKGRERRGGGLQRLAEPALFL